MHTIAIDFGTSNSQIAYLDSTGRAESLQVDGHIKIPTILYYREEQDEIFIGERAKVLYAQDILMAEKAGAKAEQIKARLSGNRLTAFKKEFCRAEVSFDDFARTLCHRNGKPFTWGEVVAAFFRFFKKEAEERRLFPGETIDSVRLTHPVHFPSCDLYRRAAEAAGFSSVSMVPEPEAAYYGYMQGGKELGDTILVFDMGGGTLDLAILEKHGGKWQVEHQPLRIDNAAGLDIDLALLKEILPRIQEYDDSLSRFCGDEKLLDDVREHIKEEWSRTERDVSFFYLFSKHNIRFHYIVPHDRLRAIVHKVMQPAYEKIRNYLVELRLVPTDVLMVGGSCLMPEIQHGVKQCMGNQVQVFFPNRGDTIVAEGAMLCGSQEENRHGIEPFEAKCLFDEPISSISADFRIIASYKNREVSTFFSLLTNYVTEYHISELSPCSLLPNTLVKSTLTSEDNLNGSFCDLSISADAKIVFVQKSYPEVSSILFSLLKEDNYAATCKEPIKAYAISPKHSYFAYSTTSCGFYITDLSNYQTGETRKLEGTWISAFDDTFRDSLSYYERVDYLEDDLPAERVEALQAPFLISLLSFSENERHLACSCSSGHIEIYDIATDNIKLIRTYSCTDVFSMQFVEHDTILVVCTEHKLLYIPLKPEQELEEWELPEPAYGHVISPDGRHIALVHQDKMTICDQKTKSIVCSIPHSGFINFISFSKDGSMLATNKGIWDVSPLLA